jgi:hypothetical protein
MATMLHIPRTPTEHAAQDERMAGIVLAHPIITEFPKAATVALAHIADGDHALADVDVGRLVLAALAAVVGAEILAGRGART